ncbi:hypothetical protein EV143_107183 [Flavobacterium chryseum]|nr:hypothetical protein EV143_107183 [Flavobacterium sp. P3160]
MLKQNVFNKKIINTKNMAILEELVKIWNNVLNKTQFKIDYFCRN